MTTMGGSRSQVNKAHKSRIASKAARNPHRNSSLNDKEGCVTKPVNSAKATRDARVNHKEMMHAAVILYNYYHRKQFPSLEFLNFESFCKIASTAKPGLLKYMKFMNRCEEDLEVLNNLTIMEKIVMEVCHVSAALDASKAFSDIEGWPISKVAVLLVDSTKVYTSSYRGMADQRLLQPNQVLPMLFVPILQMMGDATLENQICFGLV